MRRPCLAHQMLGEGADSHCLACLETQHRVDAQEKHATSVEAALDVASNYGQTDGAHHKTWVIDQMVRALLGDDYAAWVARQKAGVDGPETFDWDEGTPP